MTEWGDTHQHIALLTASETVEGYQDSVMQSVRAVPLQGLKSIAPPPCGITFSGNGLM